MAKTELLTHTYRPKKQRARALALTAESIREARPFPMPVRTASDLAKAFRKAMRKKSSTRRSADRTAPIRSEGRRPGSSVDTTDGTFQARITEKVADFRDYPYSAIGKMFFVDSNDDVFVGSGWVVGRHSFVTAAHCLFDRDDSEDFYDNITLSPAFSGSSSDRIPVVRSAIHPHYANKPDSSYLRWDIGVATVEADLIEDFGSLGYDATGEVDEDEIEAIGYPAQSRPIPPSRNGGQQDFETHNFNGQKMWHSIGDHLASSGDLHAMENEMTGGCSGGPWVIDDNISIGLNSHRLVPHDNRMFSPIFDDDFLLLINWLIEQDAF